MTVDTAYYSHLPPVTLHKQLTHLTGHHRGVGYNNLHPVFWIYAEFISGIWTDSADFVILSWGDKLSMDWEIRGKRQLR